jgi:hypothetical protein
LKIKTLSAEDRKETAVFVLHPAVLVAHLAVLVEDNAIFVET